MKKINKYARDVFGVDSVVYIFVTESMSVADLEIEWKMIRDDIAMKYQRGLTDDFERWNFYLFYVVKEIEGKEIPKYLIHKYLCYTIETEEAVYDKSFVKNDKVVELIERNNHED